MADKSGMVVYRLFSGLSAAVQQNLLKTAIEVMPSREMGRGYALSATGGDFFYPEKQDLVVATQGNRLVGSARVERAGDVAHLRGVHVFPAFADRGIESELFAHAKVISEMKWKLRFDAGGWEAEIEKLNEALKEKMKGRKLPAGSKKIAVPVHMQPKVHISEKPHIKRHRKIM